MGERQSRPVAPHEAGSLTERRDQTVRSSSHQKPSSIPRKVPSSNPSFPLVHLLCGVLVRYISFPTETKTCAGAFIFFLGKPAGPRSRESQESTDLIAAHVACQTALWRWPFARITAVASWTVGAVIVLPRRRLRLRRWRWGGRRLAGCGSATSARHPVGCLAGCLACGNNNQRGAEQSSGESRAPTILSKEHFFSFLVDPFHS